MPAIASTAAISPAMARCRSMWWLPRSSIWPPPCAWSTNHGRPATGPKLRPTSMPTRCPRERLAHVVEELGGMPLVADQHRPPGAASAAATIASASSIVRAIGFSR